jgi:hypothetical protein
MAMSAFCSKSRLYGQAGKGEGMHSGRREGMPIRQFKLARVIPGFTRSAAFLSLVPLSGCMSYSYVDSHAVQHVVGFVDVAIGPPGASPDHVSANAGMTGVRVTSIGVSAYSHPQSGSGIAIGYTRETFFSVANQSCIDFNSAGPCSRAQSIESTATIRSAEATQ